jgi:hypothetical protein
MQFRVVLPIVQTILAVSLGAWGLWQRSQLLDKFIFGSSLGWDSTARFHVWPWSFKFAVISNIPAYILGTLFSWPLSDLWPGISEMAEYAPCAVLVPVLWYWVGSRLDQARTKVGEAGDSLRRQTTVLLIFVALCVTGASIPIGYVGYISYGMMLWVVMAVTVLARSKNPSKRTAATEHESAT